MKKLLLGFILLNSISSFADTKLFEEVTQNNDNSVCGYLQEYNSSQVDFNDKKIFLTIDNAQTAEIEEYKFSNSRIGMDPMYDDLLSDKAFVKGETSILFWNKLTLKYRDESVCLLLNSRNQIIDLKY